jgi:hypothetical protein
MSQLKAKQIKLNTGDLVVGGASGNVLSVGGSETFLRIVNGSVTWGTVADTDINSSAISGATTVNGALTSLQSSLNNASSALASSLSTSSGNLLAALDSISGMASGATTYTTNSSSTYIAAATSLNSADLALDSALYAAVKSFNGQIATINGQLGGAGDSSVSSQLSAIESSVGLTSTGSLAAGSFTGSNASSATTVIGAINLLDGALSTTNTNLTGASNTLSSAITTATNTLSSAITTAQKAAEAYTDLKISALGNVFEYQGVANAVGDLSTTPPQLGYYYDVGTAFTVPAAGSQAAVVVAKGDALVFGAAGWEKIEAVTVAVKGTTGQIVVTPDSANETFTVEIDSSYIGQTSIVTLGTIGTGTWQGTTVATGFGGTGLSTVGSDNQVLTAVGGALQYAYVGALRDSSGTVVASVSGSKLVAASATTAGDDALSFSTKGYVDTAVAAVKLTEIEDVFTITAGLTAYTLTQTPVGKVSVYFNGLKLTPAEVTVAGTSVTISTSYSVESDDVIVADYTFNG